MKIAQKELIVTLALAATLWAAPGHSQTEASVEADVTAETRVNVGDGQIADRIKARFDRLPEDLQDEAEALREKREALRLIWQEQFRPGLNATVEEIRVAREAFKTAYAEEIAATREIRREIVDEMKDTIRDRFGDQEWNEEARELYQSYQAIKRELAAAWKAVLDGLPEGTTRAEIRVARERFLEVNAELVAEQKSLAQEIRELIAANRPERPERNPIPDELKDLRADIKEIRDSMRDIKRQAREDLPGLSPEEREAYLAELREDLREAHEEIKDARRAVIEDLRNGQDGDRRTED